MVKRAKKTQHPAIKNVSFTPSSVMDADDLAKEVLDLAAKIGPAYEEELKRSKGDMNPIAQQVLAETNEEETRAEAALEEQPINTEESIAAVGSMISAMSAGVPLPGVETMRMENEALGAEIKATRTQWRATGINKTKKRVVIEMLVAGTTKTNIVKVMGITPTACNSLFGDVRNLGLKIDRAGDLYSLNKEQLQFFEDYADLAFNPESVQIETEEEDA